MQSITEWEIGNPWESGEDLDKNIPFLHAPGCVGLLIIILTNGNDVIIITDQKPST